jgi:hypothetical protein
MRQGVPDTLGSRDPTSSRLVRAAVERFADQTDLPDHAAAVASCFIAALRDSGGVAALEIGVRAGGMSAILCDLAASLRPLPFMVISVDPWGEREYTEDGYDVSDLLGYGEAFYGDARRLLSQFDNSLLFRLDADTFLDRLLPGLRWWYLHDQFPREQRFLSFVYLDGRHDAASVTSEARRIAPFVAGQGVILVDNFDKCSEAYGALVTIDRVVLGRVVPPNRLLLSVAS